MSDNQMTLYKKNQALYSNYFEFTEIQKFFLPFSLLHKNFHVFFISSTN